MTRVLLALAFALFLGQATGISSALAGDDCGQRCPGDMQGGDCPPACQFCNCCSMPPTLAPPVVAVMMVPAVKHALRCAPPTVPTSPEPGEIFHVPKLPA